MADDAQASGRVTTGHPDQALGNRHSPVSSFPTSLDALAKQHWQLHIPTSGDGSAAEDGRFADFMAALSAYEKLQGRIVDSYFCSHTPAAVVNNRPTSHWFWERSELNIVFPLDGPNWTTELLLECRSLHVEISRSLISQADKDACSEMLFGLAAQLLRIVDHEINGTHAEQRTSPSVDDSPGDRAASSLPGDTRRRRLTRTDPDNDSAVYRAQLLGIRAFYERAGQLIAQSAYFSGMVIGLLLLLLPAAGLLLLPGIQVGEGQFVSVREALLMAACLVVGGLGAVVSVMQRLTSGKLLLHYRDGKGAATLLGSLRPILGAAFGILLFVLVTAEILPLRQPGGPVLQVLDPSFHFFIALAFFAGFSERFAQDMLATSQDRLVTAARTGSATTGEGKDQTVAANTTGASSP